MKRRIIPDYPDLVMYEKGENPRILITAGIHGDEYQIIDPLTAALQKHSDRLPAFWYIPQVSPSAVQLKTRKNEHGKDVNREFLPGTAEQEVLTFLSVIGDQKFELMVSCHEDWEFDSFYIYDIGYGSEENEKIKQFNANLETIGVKLFSGVDDPNDHDLNHAFVEGYHKFVARKGEASKGMMEDYVMEREIAREVWIPEIPAKISLEKKSELIDRLVDRLLTCI